MGFGRGTTGFGTKTGFEETSLNDKTHEKKVTNVVHLKSDKKDIDELELKKILTI